MSVKESFSATDLYLDDARATYQRIFQAEVSDPYDIFCNLQWLLSKLEILEQDGGIDAVRQVVEDGESETLNAVIQKLMVRTLERLESVGDEISEQLRSNIERVKAGDGELLQNCRNETPRRLMMDSLYNKPAYDLGIAGVLMQVIANGVQPSHGRTKYQIEDERVIEGFRNKGESIVVRKDALTAEIDDLPTIINQRLIHVVEPERYQLH